MARRRNAASGVLFIAPNQARAKGKKAQYSERQFIMCLLLVRGFALMLSARCLA